MTVTYDIYLKNARKEAYRKRDNKINEIRDKHGFNNGFEEILEGIIKLSKKELIYPNYEVIDSTNSVYLDMYIDNDKPDVLKKIQSECKKRNLYIEILYNNPLYTRAYVKIYNENILDVF